MTPEEQLAAIEAMAAMSDALSSLRDSLIEKGWSEGGAEQASISLFSMIVLKQ